MIIIINGVLLNISVSAVHLGHHVCINDKDCIVTAAKAVLLEVIYLVYVGLWSYLFISERSVICAILL